MKSNEKKTKTLRFDKELLDKLEYLAKLDKRSLNNFIEVILEKYCQDRDSILQGFYDENSGKKKKEGPGLRDLIDD